MFGLACTVLALSWNSANASEVWGSDTFYIGDLHAHSAASQDGASSDLGEEDESCGAVSEMVETALWNGLDFLAVSDHSNGNQVSNEEDYLYVQHTVLEGHDPKAGFIVLPAAEVFFTLGEGNRLGHKNLLLFGSDSEVANLTLQDAQPNGTANTLLSDCSDITTWMRDLESRLGPALIIPHHPGITMPMPTDWDCHVPEFSPAVEIYSRHGNSESPDMEYDPPMMEIDADGTVQSALDPSLWGYKLGFVGGTDSHDTRPGSVCAPEDGDPNRYRGGLTISVIPNEVAYSRTALYDSIIDRRSYATSGPLIPATVDYYSGGAYLGSMGDVVGIPPGQPLNVIVQTPHHYSQFVFEVVLKSIDEELIMNQIDTGEWTLTIAPDQVPAFIYPVVRVDGNSWYSDQGYTCIDGGRDRTERLWLSPTWFEPTTGDLDGDGFRWLDGDCDDGNPSRHPYAIESCTNGLDDDCDHRVDTMDDDCNFDEPTPSQVEVPHDYQRDYSPSLEAIGVEPDLNHNETADTLPLRQTGGCSSFIYGRSHWIWCFGLTVFFRREDS